MEKVENEARKKLIMTKLCGTQADNPNNFKVISYNVCRLPFAAGINFTLQ